MNTNVTSRSVTVTWSAIDCIQRNGEITGYVVQYEGGGMTNDEILITGVGTTTIEATELQPFTTYIFKVAGVSENVDPDTGPFADINITTEEEGS